MMITGCGGDFSPPDWWDESCQPTGHPPFNTGLQSGWVDLTPREEVECTIPLPFNSGEPLPTTRYEDGFKICDVSYEELCKWYLDNHKGIGPVSG